VGYTASTDGYVKNKHTGTTGSDNHENYDAWVVKLNANGDTIWTKCLGGTGDDFARSVQVATDGSGYIVGGSTNSSNGDVSGRHSNPSNYDYWVVKLNTTGGIIWQKCLGGSGIEGGGSETNSGSFGIGADSNCSIFETPSDGGYILAGHTTSNDEDILINGSTRKSGYDIWVVKLNAARDIIWQKCYGGSGDEFTYASFQKTADNGYIVGAYTNSGNGNVSGFHGGYDIWILKLDASGNISWQKCLGGSYYEYAFDIKQTPDYGYVITGGASTPYDGDLWLCYKNHGSYDYWVVKLDVSGNISWQKSFGGSGTNDQAQSVCPTSDGGYIVAGETTSPNDGNVVGNQGFCNIWVLKFTPPN
jgi:hypothetical protein